MRFDRLEVLAGRLEKAVSQFERVDPKNARGVFLGMTTAKFWRLADDVFEATSPAFAGKLSEYRLDLRREGFNARNAVEGWRASMQRWSAKAPRRPQEAEGMQAYHDAGEEHAADCPKGPWPELRGLCARMRGEHDES